MAHSDAVSERSERVNSISSIAVWIRLVPQMGHWFPTAMDMVLRW